MTANSTNVLDGRLYLQLSSSEPDIIGFGKVSGFYGPGTWAAWFLTLCGSWIGLVKDGESVDSNTFLYLAGLNWAAVDLFQHSARLTSLRHANDSSWTKQGASVGASFTVVWWGLFHTLVQLAICYKPLYRMKSLHQMQRGLVLVVGSLIPAIALSATLGQLSDTEVSNQIPALFWNGMKINDVHSAPARGYDVNAGHGMVLVYPAMVAYWTLALYVLLACRITWSKLVPRAVKTSIASWLRAARTLRRRLCPGAYSFLAFLLAYITLIIFTAVRHGSGLWYFLPLYPFILVLAALALMPSMLAQTVGVSVVYVFSAYFGIESSPQQSCFFMPCAPYSICEMDQAFALFLGIFSLVFIELVVPCLRRLRKEHRDMRLFEQEVRRRIELPAAGAGPRTGAGASDPGAGGRDTESSGVEVRAPSRVNSGIAAEEGAAGPAWRARAAAGSTGDRGGGTG